MTRGTAEQRLLLDVALAMMFADGSADPSEVAVLQEIAANTPYFSAIDAEALIRESVDRPSELQQLLVERREEIAAYAEQHDRRRRLFEVLLLVLRADGEVAPGERSFFRSVMRIASMTDVDVVRMLPGSAYVLFTVEAGGSFVPVTEIRQFDVGDSGMLAR